MLTIEMMVSKDYHHAIIKPWGFFFQSFSYACLTGLEYLSKKNISTFCNIAFKLQHSSDYT